jgi:hypothetical protein
MEGILQERIKQKIGDMETVQSTIKQKIEGIERMVQERIKQKIEGMETVQEKIKQKISLIEEKLETILSIISK